MRQGDVFYPTRELWDALRFAGRTGQHLLYLDAEGQLFEFSPVLGQMWKVVTG